MKDYTRTLVMVLLVIFAVFVLSVGAGYAVAQKNVRDWNEMSKQQAMLTPEPEEERVYFTPYENEKNPEAREYSFDTESIKSVTIYCESEDSSRNYSFTYEYGEEGLYFSYIYPKGDMVYQREPEIIQSYRADELFEIMDRYVIANTMNHHRMPDDERFIKATPEKELVKDEKTGDLKAIHITWKDGDDMETTMAKGESVAIYQYFASVADWMEKQ